MRQSLAGCFLLQFWVNENSYSTEMMAGTVSSDDLWLSCDHTFKSAANIEVQMENGSNSIMVFSVGEVFTWKLVKDLQFSSVENQMVNLQWRLMK